MRVAAGGAVLEGLGVQAGDVPELVAGEPGPGGEAEPGAAGGRAAEELSQDRPLEGGVRAAGGAVVAAGDPGERAEAAIAGV